MCPAAIFSSSVRPEAESTSQYSPLVTVISSAMEHFAETKREVAASSREFSLCPLYMVYRNEVDGASYNTHDMLQLRSHIVQYIG